MVDKPQKSHYNDEDNRITDTARKGTSNRCGSLPRETPFAGRGRGPCGEYILEQPLERVLQVEVCRVRPLLRWGTVVPREAAICEEAVNKRWYRDLDRPLSNVAEGVVFSFCNQLNRKGTNTNGNL